jgi:endonuclease/exonuclease/phosphatase family metal-dependent hydrolase
MMMRMRVLSWNVNVRRDSAAQASAIAALDPDIVALQEVTLAGLERFREAFSCLGMPYLVAGAELARAMGQEAIASRAVLLASRWPLVPCDPAPVPRHELAVCTKAQSPSGAVEVIAVHIPTWANGWLTKVETQEGVASHVRSRTGPTILLGDFNAPKDELLDGTVVPFTRPSNIRGLEAELGLTVARLGASGFMDAFRATNGYERRDARWFWKNRGRTGGFRLDHVFVGGGLRPTSCWYEHRLRKAGMSDHAPIVADVEWAAAD